MQPWDHDLETARTHHRAGRFHEAEVNYRRVLAGHPECAEAWRLLGLIAHEARRPEAAVELTERAVRLRPEEADYHNALGLALVQAGRLEEAQAAFREAVGRRSGFAAAYNNLGNACKLLGRPDEAEHALLHAVRCDPTDAALHLNLALFFEDIGRPADALVSLQVAARLAPDRADICRALGRICARLGRARESLDAYRRAAALNPNDAAVHNELGNLLQEMDRHDEARAAYRQALAADPAFAPAHSNLGYLLADEGRTDEARRHYAEALRLKPSPLLRIVADTMLSPIYRSRDEMPRVRERLVANLGRLDADRVRLDPTRDVLPTLFYLAYHGQNDRDVMAALARLTEGPRALTVTPGPRTGGDRIHIGFLSRNLKNHTIGRLMAGIIAGLDRRDFLVSVLSIGHFDDELGQRIRQSADRFVTVPTILAGALQTVAAQGLDVLFYPDVGMDPFTYTLAFTRLAPVQCVTWGHPMTTGVPALDYFLSSEALDTPDAQAHYTERLVRLPTHSVFYERVVPPVGPSPRAFFGLPEMAHVYACPQTLFKFHPDFDDLLGQILRADPEGVLVLVEGRYPTWRELLWERFGRTLPDVRDRVHFVARQSRDNYLRLLAACDVLLDPIHFGGGNSSYEGLGLGVPIVTLPSPFLRGRITYALYHKMNLLDAVVSSPTDYVRVAVELGMDAGRRQALAARIRAASMVLFEDAEAVRGLERFFRQAVADRTGRERPSR
jgi:predicted O-linked N-acetylglucosamine transferase (SPINDLY family)